MDENRIEGTFQDVAGEVQDAAGALTGDGKTQTEGKVRQVAGAVQKAYGNAADQARDVAETVGKTVKQQPLATLLAVGTIGFFVGWLVGRRA